MISIVSFIQKIIKKIFLSTIFENNWQRLVIQNENFLVILKEQLNNTMTFLNQILNITLKKVLVMNCKSFKYLSLINN